MGTTYCFRIHFRIVQRKFQRLSQVLKDFQGPYDKKELAVLQYQVQVLSPQNIRKVEKRIDALSASLVRKY